MQNVCRSLTSEFTKLSHQEPIGRGGVQEIDEDRYKSIMKRDSSFECTVTRCYFPDVPTTHATILPSWGSVKRRCAGFKLRFLFQVDKTIRVSGSLSWLC